MNGVVKIEQWISFGFICLAPYTSWLHRDHEIDRKLGTPIRNHLIFPGKERTKNEDPCKLLLSKEKAATSSRQADITAKRSVVKFELPEQTTVASSGIQNGGSAKTAGKCSRQDTNIFPRPIRSDAVRNSLKDDKVFVPGSLFQTAENKSPLKNGNPYCSSRFHPDRSPEQNYSGVRIDKTSPENTVTKKAKTSHQLAITDIRKRYFAFSCFIW